MCREPFPKMKRTLALAFTAGFVLHPSSWLPAHGPLAPPGAPAPTMKTLDQIEPRTPISSLPFTISSSGSYYLTGNLTAAASTTAITISADNVTIDLRGFTLSGTGTSGTGITAPAAQSNVVVENGMVRSFSNGVNLGAVVGARLERLVASDCGNALNSSGLRTGNDAIVRDCVVRNHIGSGTNSAGFVLGFNSIVENCTARSGTGTAQGFFSSAGFGTYLNCSAVGNAGSGFSVGSGCALKNCIASQNGGHGINAGSGCALENCAAESNTLNGFSLGTNAAVGNCSARDNGGIGFYVSDAATLHHCAAYQNAGNGFTTFAGATLSHCTAEINAGQFGIFVSSASTLIGCTVRASTNAGIISGGINIGTECHISQCVVSNIASTAGTLTATTGMGINTGNSCTIERCTVQGCKGDGIRASNSSLILNNTCDRNGDNTGDGAGVHTTGTENRIEGNSVTGNDRGIDVDGGGNLIIKNTAATNTTAYEIAASNRFGPIINLSAAGTAAQSVNDASANVASVLVSSDPWANFLY